MTSIYLHQLREYFASLRLHLGLLVVLAFFAVNGLTSAWRMEQHAEQEMRYSAQVAEAFEVESLSDAVGSWYQARNSATGVEFIAEGGFKWMWGSYNFTPQRGIPWWWYIGRDVNFWMSRFENIDWLLIARIVLSFLAVVLAYDAISGEAERGTLRQVLTNPLSRARVLTAKYLAGFTVVMLATLLGVVVSLLILSLYGVLQVTGTLLSGVAFFFLGTALYVSLFLFLSLAVSSLTGNSVSSLVLLTLLWAFLVVIVPQTSYLVAMNTAELEFFPVEIWDERDQLEEALGEQGIVFRDPSRAAADDFALERQLARHLDEFLEAYDSRIIDWFGRQLDRFRIARAVNLLSPGYAFQYATEALIGAGVSKRQSFFRQARDYHHTVLDFLRGRDAADPESGHVLWVPEYMSHAKLDGTDVPRFGERPPDMAERFAWGGVPLLALVLEAVAACLFAVWAVNRVDVTGYAMAES